MIAALTSVHRKRLRGNEPPDAAELAKRRLATRVTIAEVSVTPAMTHAARSWGSTMSTSGSNEGSSEA